MPLAAHAQLAEHPADGIQTVQVRAQKLGETTGGTGSYTTGKDRTAIPLSLSLRETPQSVTVVTQQRIEDQTCCR